MNGQRIPKSVVLAYFSGTGCTKAVCDCFEQQFLEQGLDCKKINMAVSKYFDIETADTLIIFSPVYAFRLTSVTEQWVKNLPEVKNKSAVIISVSGGGEVSPNTACRVYCKGLLKKKGYDLIYEKMIIMPSNFAAQAERNLNLGLLKALPQKVQTIIADIVSGKKNITAPKFQDRCFAAIGKAQQIGARFFGASIRVAQCCNKCGLCIRSCPKKNIKLVNGLPKFGFHCMFCLRCIYNCPCKALTPGILKFAVLKDGFDLRKMSEQARKENIRINYQQDKDILWQGVVDYLSEDDYLKK
jgi:ferredoxin